MKSKRVLGAYKLPKTYKEKYVVLFGDKTFQKCENEVAIALIHFMTPMKEQTVDLPRMVEAGWEERNEQTETPNS